MRFYGKRSGRNKPSRFIARSFMFNSNKASKKIDLSDVHEMKNKCNQDECKKNNGVNSNGFTTISLILAAVIDLLICCKYPFYTIYDTVSGFWTLLKGMLFFIPIYIGIVIILCIMILVYKCCTSIIGKGLKKIKELLSRKPKLGKVIFGILLFAIVICIFIFLYRYNNRSIENNTMSEIKEAIKSIQEEFERDNELTEISINNNRYYIEIKDSYFNQCTYEQMIQINEKMEEKIKNITEQYRITFNCNEELYVIESGQIFINNKKVYDQTEVQRKREEEENIKNLIETYGEDYPNVGMREDALQYTILGAPDKVEKCRDYDALDINHKYKTYTWGNPSRANYYIVTISYRKYYSHRVDDYVDLPIDNGYVSRIWYTDSKGVSHSENYVETIN